MSHFVTEILPANITGVKTSVATFKEIYILERCTRPDWWLFQLTMQFYELQNSGRLNGVLSRRSLFLKTRMNGRMPDWPVSCTKNESFTRLHPQQVAGRLCLECQPLTRPFPALPRPQVEATTGLAASACGLETEHNASCLKLLEQHYPCRMHNPVETELTFRHRASSI